MNNLILYYKPTCGYCARVLRYMQDHNISVELKDVNSSPDVREDLIEKGGKSQVPCLFIDGQPLYESADIIDWLQNNITNT